MVAGLVPCVIGWHNFGRTGFPRRVSGLGPLWRVGEFPGIVGRNNRRVGGYNRSVGGYNRRFGGYNRRVGWYNRRVGGYKRRVGR